VEKERESLGEREILMGWSIGYDSNWKRDIGYGVPAYCDDPDCDIEIDRGLAHVCGGEPYGGEFGCGLYFCFHHLYIAESGKQYCERCETSQPPFTPKPEHPEWIQYKLTDESWKEWRNEHPEEVAALKKLVSSNQRE
jgi:hypothetical protein